MITLINTAPAVKTASAVFIDVPNVAKGLAHWHSLFKWERLSQAIASSNVLQNTTLVRANSYVTLSRDIDPLTNWAKMAFQTFGRQSFKMKTRWIDDVDSMIIGDMWKSVTEREQEVLAEYSADQTFRMRFVLVSGDGDYAPIIDDIRATFGERLHLELHVYSWNKSLSEELHKRAVQVTSLESIPGFVRKEFLLKRA